MRYFVLPDADLLHIFLVVYKERRSACLSARFIYLFEQDETLLEHLEEVEYFGTLQIVSAQVNIYREAIISILVTPPTNVWVLECLSICMQNTQSAHA